MSNCKKVHIGGFMPFNTTDHEGLNKMLGQLNAPTFGIRIQWRSRPENIRYQSNEHGGRTTLYDFVIEGMEVVSDFWLAHLVKNIRAHGGTITTWACEDIEAPYKITMGSIEKLAKELA